MYSMTITEYNNINDLTMFYELENDINDYLNYCNKITLQKCGVIMVTKLWIKMLYVNDPIK